MIRDNFKRVSIGIVLASVLAVSANAICITDKYCTNSYVGVGGFYEDISGNSAEIKNTVGFFAFGASDVFANRFHYGADLKVGHGSNSLSGSNLSALNSSNNGLYVDALSKIGVNIATPNSPLFVNFLFGADCLFLHNGVGRLITYIGAGIEGKLSMSDKFGLTYSAGYGYGLAGAYLFGKEGVKSLMDNPNHIFMASLGVQIKMTENTNFYFKGFGKYYDLGSSKSVQVNNQAISMPNAKLWQAGVEAGISF